MKRLFALLPGLLLAGPLLAQGTGAVQQEVIAVSKAYSDAQVKKDRAAFERIIADDYSFIHSNGSVLNKSQEVAQGTSSGMNWTSSKLDELNVRAYGDVAILTGREILEGAGQGYASGARRFTEIFVKQSGRWQLVGGQSTLVPAK